MKKQYATRLNPSLIEKMKRAVENNKPYIQSAAHFLEMAIEDLLNKLKDKKGD